MPAVFSTPLQPIGPVDSHIRRAASIRQWLRGLKSLASSPPPLHLYSDIRQSLPLYTRSCIVSDIRRGFSGKRIHWWAEKNCLLAYYLIPSLRDCGYGKLSVSEFAALGDYFDKFAIGVTCLYLPSAHGACVPKVCQSSPVTDHPRQGLTILYPRIRTLPTVPKSSPPQNGSPAGQLSNSMTHSRAPPLSCYGLSSASCSHPRATAIHFLSMKNGRRKRKRPVLPRRRPRTPANAFSTFRS